jgi:OmpA-OmpF porin, OOP family
MNLNKIKMTKISTLASALLLTGGLFAQDNLVVNGSFEDYTGRVKKEGSIDMSNGWASATGVKADFFAPSKEGIVNTPDNIYGSEAPKDGDCYAGIVAYSYGDKIPRSYLITRLSETLKKGKKYCVSYNVSLAEGSKYAVNQMGMLFSKSEFESDSKAILQEDAQVKSDKIFNAVFGWHQICGVFIAQGGEKFLTLGNFNPTLDIKNEKNKLEKGSSKVTPMIAAYYYIDDVIVYEMDDETACECTSDEPSEEFSTMIYQKQIRIDETKSTPKQIVEAQELYFGFGQDNLTPLSESSLDVIAKIMMANPTLRLEIMGHTDAMEDEVGEEKEIYADMDNKRIAAVMDYLKSKQVAVQRMVASPQGSGEANPNISDSDEEEVAQAKNRRVVFVVR